MKNDILEVKNVSKIYHINHSQSGYITLRDVLTNISQRPFKFFKTKAKQIVGIEKKEEFWALKNINFSLKKGEVLGVIGSNGAGKSTLLKILSRITPPSEGEVRINGKLGSLLEVGTGFHPELSGRENIMLNGAILGMTKKEIIAKFDEIVEFAGINNFLDTPVKYYSSGMYVRLAFSVAAHMEPDILLVDEVLAVGDLEFQKKCLGKMEEVTKKSGRTIIFVSHNMSAIQNLCQRSILLEKGEIIAEGNTADVIDIYLSRQKQNKVTQNIVPTPGSRVSISSISVNDSQNYIRTELPISEPFSLNVKFDCKEPLPTATVSCLIYTAERDLLLFSSESDMSGKLANFEIGNYNVNIKIPAFLLNVGLYSADIIIHNPNLEMFAEVRDINFEIQNTNNPRSIIFQRHHPGKIALPLKYEISKI